MRDKLKTPKERFEYVIRTVKEIIGEEAFLLLKNAIIITTNKINNKSYSLGYSRGLKTGKETSENTENGNL